MNIAYKRFSFEDQKDFANLSLDYNPLHVNDLWSRRTVIGEIVVHGIHLLLWALESYLQKFDRDMSSLTSLEVMFINHVPLSLQVNTTIEKVDDHVLVLLINDDEKNYAKFIFSFTPQRSNSLTRLKLVRRTQDHFAPRSLKFEEVSTQHGELILDANGDAISTMFPHCTGALGIGGVGLLAKLAFLVVMECPGKNALFSAFSLNFDSSPAESISWQVKRATKPLIIVKIQGPGLHGEIKTFYLPDPIAQPSVDDINKNIGGKDFVGQTALIIGGSRGLGELTAKILACGGGHVIITWYRGKDEAQSICNELKANGYSTEAFNLDINGPTNMLNIVRTRKVTHVYYYATPKISGSSQLNRELYFQYYVTSFEKICKTLSMGRDLSIFYPSTVFVDEKQTGLTAYSDAKKAGEELCESIEERFPKLHIVKARLPRLQTDQNLGLFPVKCSDSIPTLYPILRSMAHRMPTQQDL